MDSGLIKICTYLEISIILFLEITYIFFLYFIREIRNVDLKLRVGYGNVKNKVSCISYLEIMLIIKLIEKISINYYSVTK